MAPIDMGYSTKQTVVREYAETLSCPRNSPTTVYQYYEDNSSSIKSLHISTINDHVSELSGSIDLTIAKYTRPLIDNQVLSPLRRCLKLTNANEVFCMREDTSSDMQTFGEIRLPK